MANSTSAQGFPGGSDSKESTCNKRDPGSIPGPERSPGEGMAIHFSILAWRIPRTEEPSGLQSMGLQRIGHNGATNTFILSARYKGGFPSGARGKESTCQCRRPKGCWFDPWVGKIPWRRKWQPIPVPLPGKSHGQRSLVGYSPWGCKE